MKNIKKIKNKNKKKFDHSSDFYYCIEISDKVKLYFTAPELNKALQRYKKNISKTNE